MRLSHARRVISVRFDDSNLVSCVGLAAVLALAARCGLGGLVTDRVRIAAKGGVNAAAKIVALVAGMVAGADSISDMDLLRHGGMGRLFDEVRAPSTLGTFLRLFTFGHIRQLDAVAAGFLARLTAATPVLPGMGQVAFVDVDDTVRATYGYAKSASSPPAASGPSAPYTDPVSARPSSPSPPPVQAGVRSTSRCRKRIQRAESGNAGGAGQRRAFGRRSTFGLNITRGKGCCEGARSL
jgi:hypothetical protein